MSQRVPVFIADSSLVDVTTSCVGVQSTEVLGCRVRGGRPMVIVVVVVVVVVVVDATSTAWWQGAG